MTLTQQALHIFQKDVRRLRFEIAALSCLIAFLVWYWTDSWSGETNVSFDQWRPREPIGPYLAAFWFLLIARLMHAEPLVGDRHFWLTRPYSRSAVLLAKGLFVVAFLLLPLLLVQALAVSSSGLPVSLGGLLLNQLAIAAVVCLPAAAVAALTPSLWYYMPIVAAGTFAAFAVHSEVSATRIGPVPLIVGAMLLGAFSIAALLVQFHGRRTLRNAGVYVAVGAAVALLVAAFPRELARAAESAFVGSDARNSLIFHVGPPSESGGADDFTTPSGRPFPLPLQPEIRLPIQVTGADLRDLLLTNPTVTFRTATGQTFRSPATVRWGEESHLLVPLIPMRSPSIMNEPVSLHVEFWVKRFRSTTATLPADGSAVMLDGREQCRALSPGSYIVSADSPYTVRCRHARSTSLWREYDLRRVSELEPGIRLSSRVTIPTIDPIKHVQVPPAGFRSLFSERERTVVLRERVAFFRATLDADNLRLADYVEQQR